MQAFLGNCLILFGVLGILAGGAWLCFPTTLRAGLIAFPRSKWPGWLLTAICLIWVAWVIQHAALGRFEAFKPLIPVAGVLVFAAIVWFMDELLAPRALGGLLLLLANPVLNGVRWADSSWRFVPVLMAYAWVIAGCALMLHPWVFRKTTERLMRSASTIRVAGWSKLVGGAIMLAAGLWQLR